MPAADGVEVLRPRREIVTAKQERIPAGDSGIVLTPRPFVLEPLRDFSITRRIALDERGRQEPDRLRREGFERLEFRLPVRRVDFKADECRSSGHNCIVWKTPEVVSRVQIGEVTVYECHGCGDDVVVAVRVIGCAFMCPETP